MSNSAVAEREAPPRELTVVEQHQQLITIEPIKYVALVFERHRNRADAYKAEAPTVTYDITTAVGMKTAVEWRAKGRSIRVEAKDIHKERKAPILEVGRLMDGALKEIVADVEPDEDRFDQDIKTEEARKEAEKQAKFAAEQARVAAIRARIDEIRNTPANMVGKSSEAIGLAATHLSESIIDLGEYAELTGEAVVERNNTVTRLREMQAAQLAHEQAVAEAARQAEMDRVERERVAEANRVEAKRLADLAAELERKVQEARDTQAEADRIAREQREAEEARLRAEREAHEAELSRQRAAEEARLRTEREVEEQRLAEQRAELARQQAAIDAANAERERVERKAREADAAAQELGADHAEALIENARIDEEIAVAAEAARVEAQRQAAESERLRRERVQFELNGPAPTEMVAVLAKHYGVTAVTVEGWMCRHVWAELEGQHD